METIRIFNLNGALRERRRTAIAGYIDQAREVREMVASGDFTIAEGKAFLKDELVATANQPFATAIKHMLIPT